MTYTFRRYARETWPALVLGLTLAGAVGAATACVDTATGPKLRPDVAPWLDLGVALACPLQDLAQKGLAADCPGESAAFAAVVAAETAPASPAPGPTSAPSSTAISSPGTSSTSPDAGSTSGAPAMAALHRRGGPGEAPLVPIGVVPAGPDVARLQRRALALPPGPQRPPTVLPVVADGGRDGAP